MALVTKRRLPPPKDACKKCKTSLEVGAEYHTILTEDEKVWNREEYCTTCFKPTEQMTWKGKIKPLQEQPISCSNEKILEEMLQTSEPLWLAFLAEVLLRKGVIRLRGNKFIEVVHTAELIELERQTLPIDQLPTFHYRLEKLIERT